jgi:hypothetical protein
MSREELAVKFVDSKTELERARRVLQTCEDARSESEADRDLYGGVLDSIVRGRADQPAGSALQGASAIASGGTAIEFAESANRLESVEVKLVTARALVDSLARKADDALRALRTSCRTGG